jgi:hypothetical protein
MTQNVLDIGKEIVWMLGGAAVLLIFGLFLALPHRPRTLPGSSGHREKEGEAEHEVIRPDGYIDSFAGVIEEAGGAPPPVVWVALVGIWLWWLLYLIFNWTPQ